MARNRRERSFRRSTRATSIANIYATMGRASGNGRRNNRRTITRRLRSNANDACAHRRRRDRWCRSTITCEEMNISMFRINLRCNARHSMRRKGNNRCRRRVTPSDNANQRRMRNSTRASMASWFRRCANIRRACNHKNEDVAIKTPYIRKRRNARRARS